MNPILPSHSAASSMDAAAESFARRVTARLESGAQDLPYDISERMRAARMQALAQRKVAVAPKRERVPGLASATAPVRVAAGGGTAAWGHGGLGGGHERSGWWNALVSAIPILALLIGLVVINDTQEDLATHEIAEVDSALLADELPPSAYADPGFIQFLKTSTENR